MRTHASTRPPRRGGLRHVWAGPSAGEAPAKEGTDMNAVSGITPSGRLTLGNHLGALRRFAAAGDGEHDFYFVADLHAMTTRHDPRRLRSLTRETAGLMLAAGLPPA